MGELIVNTADIVMIQERINNSLNESCGAGSEDIPKHYGKHSQGKVIEGSVDK